MKNWFEDFESCLYGGTPSGDLIGAGSADSSRAMAHYRYQHQAKMKEAVEVTLPKTLSRLGEKQEVIWAEFWMKNETSPRSLDWFPEVFLRHFEKTDSPEWLKELARFEHLLDVHPWNHRMLSLKPDLAFDECSQLILGNHEIISFDAPVTKLYEDETCDHSLPESVLIWQKESGVYYRAMKDWELVVLSKLPLGVGEALEHAPEDAEAVGEFFQWLGSSCLIQEVRPDSP